ncbi:MAG: transcriptional repressor [Gammaproteobacteria bacterium]
MTEKLSIAQELKKRQEVLRSAGLRATHQRTLVMEKLREVEHISAEKLHNLLREEGVSTNLPTIYRVLSDLESVGLVDKHSFQGNHSVYELASRSHHDHLICIDCGHVIEFMDEVIEQRQDAVCQQQEMKLINHTMYLYGTCCRVQCPNRNAVPKTD